MNASPTVPLSHLFRVAARVTPKKEHPKFWDWESGVLFVWLFTSSHEDAGERAAALIEQLPYELTSTKLRIVKVRAIAPKSIHQGAVDDARALGLGLVLAVAPLDADEDPFAAEWEVLDA